MSRKGNCHDNAPIENFFSLLKRECLNQYKIQNLTELGGILKSYIKWFNNDRTSMKTKGLSPVGYRNQTLIA
ncbi:IS3 family transposase [Levilactobacillus namurensis]|uniref:IS3 family transposase n=1 Tax=Levilactobacillus namurensis TaxID=380393 RepID=UPI0034C67FA1